MEMQELPPNSLHWYSLISTQLLSLFLSQSIGDGKEANGILLNHQSQGLRLLEYEDAIL